jgi:hypothetical protein
VVGAGLDIAVGFRAFSTAGFVAGGGAFTISHR